MPLLVLPMGSDPELRILMHFGRSYLYFHPLAVGTNHGGVEALISIGLRAARHNP